LTKRRGLTVVVSPEDGLLRGRFQGWARKKEPLAKTWSD